MKFLDERLNNFSEIIDNTFPVQQPVILLMDNINMYRGKHRHDRLYKSLGPKMWNFTGRGALVPNLVGIEDLFITKETCIQPQRPVQELLAKDVLIGEMFEFLLTINYFSVWRVHNLLVAWMFTSTCTCTVYGNLKLFHDDEKQHWSSDLPFPRILWKA